MDWNVEEIAELAEMAEMAAMSELAAFGSWDATDPISWRERCAEGLAAIGAARE